MAVGGGAVDVVAAVFGGEVVAGDVDVDVDTSASLAHAARNLLAGKTTSPSPAVRRNRLRSTYLPGTATIDSDVGGSAGGANCGVLRNSR